MKSEHIGQSSSHQSLLTFQQPYSKNASIQYGMSPTKSSSLSTNIHAGGNNTFISNTNNINNRLPCPQIMNMKSTPTKVQLSTPTKLQVNTPTKLQTVSPAKLHMGTPTKMKGSTPKKIQGMGKSPMKPGMMKPMSVGKSPTKLAGKPGLVKPPGTVTSASNAAYKEWKNKFGNHDEHGFHCNMCPERKSFTADSSLRRHYTQAHEQVCKTCKMEFSEEHLLQQHYREKHEFRCLICSKIFTAFSSVRRHHEQAHAGEPLPKGETPVKLEVQMFCIYSPQNISLNITKKLCECVCVCV